MDNNENIQELEEMRQQLSLLNRKLNREKIVNEQLIRDIMSRKIVNLVATQQKLIVAGIVLILPIVVYSLKGLLNCSLPFTVVTALFLVIGFLYSWYTQHGVSGSELLNGNLLAVSRKLIRYRRLGNRWFFFSIPFLIVWIPWFFHEALQFSDSMPIIVGGMVGGIFGGIMGFRYYRQSQATIKEVLGQIDELTGGE